MKYIAAYVLLVLGGKTAPTVEDVTNLITNIGGEVDTEKLTTLFTDIEGKDIHELLAKGENDLKSVVAAGPAAAGGAPAAGGAAPAAAAAAPEKPKEEEVDALDGGMDMFGGGGGGGGDY
eukprot:gene1243-1355_t